MLHDWLSFQKHWLVSTRRQRSLPYRCPALAVAKAFVCPLTATKQLNGCVIILSALKAGEQKDIHHLKSPIKMISDISLCVAA